MNYARTPAQNIPYPTSASTVPGPRYPSGPTTDFEMEFCTSPGSPDLFPVANASGHFGSANGLTVIRETDPHSLGSLDHYPSDFYYHYKPGTQQASQSLTMPPPATTAPPQSASSAGQSMGLATSLDMASSYKPSTLAQKPRSMLTSRLKALPVVSLPQEYQKFTQSPVAYDRGHFKSSSMDSSTNPGLSMTPSSSSSRLGSSFGLSSNSYGSAKANSLLFADLDWIPEQTNGHKIPTPTVSVGDYDLDLDHLNLLSPEPMVFDGLDMTDIVGTGTDDYVPTSAPLDISSFGAQHIKRSDSLRVPSLSMAPNTRTHPYPQHNRRRSSTSSSYATTPYIPFELTMTGLSPSSPFDSSPMFSTSPSAMDILLLPTSPNGRGPGTSRAGSVAGSQPTADHAHALLSRFSPAQQSAARAIIQYMADHPKTPIPATYITQELVEIKDNRGKCLIGSCALDRKEKRVDHLYDHVRDKHFECRPYACNMCAHTFSRDHDLKRHLQVHEPKTLECPTCSKSYTRLDNLQRHVQQKHGQITSSSRLLASRFSL